MKSYSLLFVGLLATLSLTEGYVVCYYGSWANYRYGNGHYTIDNIDPFLCDELVYSFAGINSTSYEIMVLDPFLDLYDDFGKGGYEHFTNLRRMNPRLKTTLSVGGWNQGSETFSIMAADPDKREVFVSSVLKLVIDHKFDGLDMDWEFPGQRGGLPEDKLNYVTLLQEMRASFDIQGLSLSAAVPASINSLQEGFQIPYLNNLLDYIHVMTYDYHGAWEDFTHHHSPLEAHPRDDFGNQTLNIKYTIDYLIEEGASPEKLLLGVPTYGRCYTLASEETGFYAPTSGPSRQGPYTGEPGYLGYNEICELQYLSGDWVKVLDEEMNEPYAYRVANQMWCGYDDPKSVMNKANYAREKGLGGVMTWSIETDDFIGICGRPYDLIKSMREGFERPETTPHASTTTSPATVTTTELPTETTTLQHPSTTWLPDTTASQKPTIISTLEPDTTTSQRPGTTTTRDPGAKPDCDDSGTYFLPDEYCDQYWQCSNGEAYHNFCPPGLYWNTELNVCDFPQDVDTSNCIEPERK